MIRSFFSDGLSQQERYPAALNDGFVRVDESSLADLLSQARDMARTIRYAPSSNDVNTTWEKFFNSDEIYILSSIIALDVVRLEHEFESSISSIQDTCHALAVEELSPDNLHSIRLARKFDNWLYHLSQLGQPQSSVSALRAREQLVDLIEKSLSLHLRQMGNFLESLRPELSSCLKDFDPIWQQGSAVAESVPDVSLFLRSNFYAFCAALRVLQGRARELLELSLGRNDHDPSHGLYLAFLQLFLRVQAQINRFPVRHQSFYYEDVLKVTSRPFTPDQMHLVLSADKTGKMVKIPKGAAFFGGRDAGGAELIYRASAELFVSDARVISLRTLNFSRSPLCSPEYALVDKSTGYVEGAPRGYVTSATINSFTQDQVSASGEMTLPTPLSLFGAGRPTGTHNDAERATLGFAIGDNILLLREGRRSVSVVFRFDIVRSGTRLAEFTRQLSDILQTTQQDAFFKAFRFMFRISLTSESGWLAVDEYVPIATDASGTANATDSLAIKFTVPDRAPAIVPYSTGVHGGTIQTDLPLIRFLINPDAYFFPYSLISQLVLDEIAIDVAVEGVTSLKIYNQLGQLSTGAQFAPFGPVPNQGDYLVVGSHEAATKKLAAFELSIQWANLPQGKEGFAQHYLGYPSAYSNTSFIAGLYALRDRRWVPGEDSHPVRALLFQTRKASAKDGRNALAPRVTLDFSSMCSASRQLSGVDEADYRFDAMAKDGFFRVSLKSPQQAFGHREYGLALSNAMTRQARQSRSRLARLFRGETKDVTLPNPAYTPTINSISCSYKASASLSFDQVSSGSEFAQANKFFLLYPFGYVEVQPRSFSNLSLLPRFAADGNLHIEISATSLGGPLTLYFHLAEDSQPEAGTRTYDFRWYYLADNQWRQLDPTQVVADTTNGFLTSGIVSLDIPSDVSSNNTLMPNGSFWLRLSSDSPRLGALASLYGVHANALIASWIPEEGSNYSHLRDGLPAGSVKEAVPTIPGIRDIRQYARSFGGVPPESGTQRSARTSERLSHKGRAIVPRDYERLVLEQFPSVFRVKCFSCLTGLDVDADQPRPGNVLLVVLPPLSSQDGQNVQPMVNAKVLREIREFVSALAPASVRVHLRNPAYEQVQVRCKVKFRGQGARGNVIKRLETAINDYLSPWSSTGHRTTFGWQMRCNDIQAYLHGLDDVAAVSGLSLLRIAKADSDHYALSDSVRMCATDLFPTMPWSVAIPSERHLIDVVEDGRPWDPEESGIAHLAIGSSFVVSKESP